jgi:hypothetical protein
MIQPTARNVFSSQLSLSGLWSLFWRAVLLTPFALVFGGLWVAARPLLFLLPVCAALCLWNGDWVVASVVAAVWVLALLWTRSRWFKMDRRDFPNEQENV